MKNIHSLIIILVFTTYCTKAQLRVGFKAGVNLSSIQGSGYTDPDQKLFMGLDIGGLVNYSINQKFSLQPELFFSQEGTQWKSADYDQKNRLNYLNIPLLVQYSTPSGFFAQTGPQMGLLVSAKMKYKENRSAGGIVEVASQDEENPDGLKIQKVNIKNSYARSPVSWVFGAGYIHESGFGINARYNIGLSNILMKTSVTSIHSRIFNIGITYMLHQIKK